MPATSEPVITYVGAVPVNGIFEPFSARKRRLGYTASVPVGGQGNAGERPEHQPEAGMGGRAWRVRLSIIPAASGKRRGLGPSPKF